MRALKPFRILAIAAILHAHHAGAAQKYILIDGSSTVYPVMRLVADAFSQSPYGRGVNIQLAFSGTTSGFRKFLAGEIDIANASRPILRDEIRAAKTHDIQFIEIPIGFDALTIAVNKENTWADTLSISELKKMWESAAERKITRWNQIRPEWPDLELKLYGAGRDSGTFDYFSEVAVGKLHGLRNDYIGSEDDTELVKGIESHKGALGFIPFNYFYEAGDNLTAVPIQWDYDAIRNQPVKGAAAVAPSEDAVLRGSYIPLGRPLFIYVNRRALEAKPHLRDFLHLFLINADSFLAKVHFVDLPAIAYARAIADLENETTGTRLSGEPEVGISAYDLLNRRPR